MQVSIKKSYVQFSNQLLIGSRFLFADEKIKYPQSSSLIKTIMKFLLNPKRFFIEYDKVIKIQVENKVTRITEEQQGTGTRLTDIMICYEAIMSKTIVVLMENQTEKMKRMESITRNRSMPYRET